MERRRFLTVMAVGAVGAAATAAPAEAGETPAEMRSRLYESGAAPQCADCLFWSRERVGVHGPYGRCHRSAPKPNDDLDVSAQSTWVFTYGTDWCGEYLWKAISAARK